MGNIACKQPEMLGMLHTSHQRKELQLEVRLELEWAQLQHQYELKHSDETISRERERHFAAARRTRSENKMHN